MPRPCSVCQHKKRAAIDKALVAGESVPTIAARYSPLRRSALQRHKDSHLPAALAKAQEAVTVAHADSLLDQVKGLQVKTLGILAKAESAGDLRAAVAAIREARGNVELLAKLNGELQSQPIINILLTDEWIRLRSAILQALDPYPDAIEAVSHAISR